MPCADAANGVVGPGNCDEGGFASVLSTVDNSGGGTITFNCGTAVFVFNSYKQIAHAVTIDGGGAITIDGANTSGFFQVFSSANATLKGLSLVRGKYIGGVRAIENFGALTLDHVRLVNNNASDRGPVVNYGLLTVRASTFSNNAGTASNADGGAIENDSGQLRVISSTFNGNNAARHGGAIYSNFDFSVINSTFNANTANSGGAIYQDGTGESSIVFATIVANVGTAFSGGVYNDGLASSTLTISRSIISGNGNGNCDGVLISGGYNLWAGTTTCPFSAPGDLGATTPTLTPGALANNGGPTLTMLPAGGNVAINHVPSAQCLIPVDQRGAVRPSGAGCDSGAVEVGGSLTDLIFYDGFE
ncbi:MAG: choice-of-anchor Q domain-containing protein [Dokdonella sp.]